MRARSGYVRFNAPIKECAARRKEGYGLRVVGFRISDPASVDSPSARTLTCGDRQHVRAAAGRADGAGFLTVPAGEADDGFLIARLAGVGIPDTRVVFL